MNQTRYLQMVRTNQFERAYRRWKDRKLTQGEAAAQLEMSERTFRRYVARYREGGKDGLLDRRLGRVSPRRVGEEEVSDVVVLYRDRYPDRNIRHFYEAYQESHEGGRSYSWVKNVYRRRGWFQRAGVVVRTGMRERKGQEGGMIHARTGGFPRRSGI